MSVVTLDVHSEINPRVGALAKTMFSIATYLPLADAAARMCAARLRQLGGDGERG
jgi:hypothetical protein